MHIKQVIVEGFKCYKDRIEAEPFSPKHNVVGERPRTLQAATAPCSI
jgi:hypothetical protein